MNTSGLINKIATQLTQEILAGTIAPNHHMVAQQIADKYRVSRTPAREALITLEKFHLLERQPHRGYFVTEESPQSKAKALLKKLGGDKDYYLQLVEDWLSDDLPDIVTEQYLRQRYDLTKTRLSDLLARAAREGWAESKEGYGWSFLPVAKTAEAFDDIYRFRLAIEPVALLEPGFEINFGVLTELRRTQEQMLEVDLDQIPAEKLLANGAMFHEELIKLSHNAYFYSALQRANQMRRLMEYRAEINRERLIGECNEHLEMISHLEAGEIVETSYLMRRHLQGALKRKSARTGAVTLIQRFGSALNLNIHFHMLFLDGVYVDRPDGSARFRWVSSPTTQELTQLSQTIARRVGRYLERQGLLEQDAENSYLTTDAVSEDPMNQLLGHSITYRIAVGPQAGRKVFTLQTLPGCGADEFADTVGKVCGFSLHAGVAARADERKKLERLCRYISRPAVSEKRLSLTSVGNIRYQLKTPYRDGTTHVIFEPLDFMARLAALAPKPRANLTRFHGVFAPNSKHRALITPAKRGKSTKRQINGDVRSPVEQHAAMSWAQRLKRVFNIDISNCDVCGSAVKVIASIEDPVVIKQILAHLERKAESKEYNPLPESRAPPQIGLFG